MCSLNRCCPIMLFETLYSELVNPQGKLGSLMLNLTSVKDLRPMSWSRLSPVRNNMRRQASTSASSRSTILRWQLLLVLIAPAIVAVPAQPRERSIVPTKGHFYAQASRHPYGIGNIDRSRFDSSRIVAQAVMPTAPPPNRAAAAPAQPPRRHIVRGAGRGAALGAVGGAIAGDAGKGAAAGAAMGGMAGGFRRRDERRQQSLSPR